jgi:CubicO group peptidase (beta-lactamase class C family)
MLKCRKYYRESNLRQNIFYVFAVVLVLSATAFSNLSIQANDPSLDAERMNDFIEDQMRRHGLPGVAVAITQGDEVVYLRGFGNAAPNQAMTPDTPMFIGSLSKSFTALAIMQLQEQGKLNVDDPVVKYLPSFRIADPEASHQITVRNLLNHTSGLSDFSYLPEHEAGVSIMDSLTYLRSAELSAPIGETFQYFNSNYAILGAIVESVSGMPYGEYVEKNIYEPLDMGNSYTNHVKATTAGLPQGYGNFFGFSIQRRQPFRVFDLPAGYLMMSVNNLSHYLRAQLHEGIFNGQRILSAAGVREMHTPQPGLDVPYGMGWFAYEKFGLQYIEHGGTNENFHTAGILLPEKDMTIAILTNKNSIFHALFGNQQLNDGVVSIAAGLPLPRDGFPIRLIGYIMLGGFILNLANNICSLTRLNCWHQKFEFKKTAAKIWDVSSNFVIPVLLIVLLPVGISAYLQRGFSWEAGWSQAPDGIFWLFAGILFDLIQGSAKIRLLLKERN